MLGNVYESTLVEVLNGDRFREFMTIHTTMDMERMPEECRRCEQLMDKGFLKNYSVAYKIYYLNDFMLNVKWQILLWGYMVFSELKKHRFTFPLWKAVTNALLGRELHGSK